MEIDNSLVRNDEANEEKISSVRPKSFKDFIGQSDAKNNLIIFAKSAKKEIQPWTMFCFMVPQD